MADQCGLTISGIKSEAPKGLGFGYTMSEISDLTDCYMDGNMEKCHQCEPPRLFIDEAGLNIHIADAHSELDALAHMLTRPRKPGPNPKAPFRIISGGLPFRNRRKH